MEVTDLQNLKRKKNAVILAHYYQTPDIQDAADFVGDSLALAKKAAQTDAEIIVFAGVHFMAETAKIINPAKKVLLPDLQAGCSLADSCPPADFADFVEHHPEHTVVSYINCSAEVKALSDLVCTSSNAVDVINSVPEDQPIIFAPDKNLGRYLAKVTGRNMLLWDGSCIVHEAFDLEKITSLKTQNPSAELIAHPESEEHILNLADFIGSTSALLHYASESNKKSFIVATEHGILHKMRNTITGKEFIPAPGVEDNTCACSECAFMKVNTMDKLIHCLENETPEIQLERGLIERAAKPIQRMFEISRHAAAKN